MKKNSMRITDLFAMSINNLRRRKLRTVLTVLGVVIGTAAVVVMMSLGIGLNNLTQQLYESFGSMTAIDVSMPYDTGQNNSKNKPLYITDDVIKQLSTLEHVKSVSPMLQVDVILRQGIYQCQTQLIGTDRNYMNNMEIGQGHLPESGELEFVYGNLLVSFFRNIKTNKGYWDTNVLPDIDYMDKPMFVIFDTDAYYNTQSTTSSSSEGTSSTGESTTKISAPKKYLIKTAAVLKGDTETYNQYSYGIYTDIDALKMQLKKVFRSRAIPGQPTTKKGKPYKYFIYNSAVVYCDNMNNVTKVQKAIQDMGFQANSNMEWLEQSKQQSNMIQAVLGGIGAVSLLVAAIGIANTMMMSIYERTKEIGIIKVLGCDMVHIRDMFLVESGFIGLVGGILGVIISYIVSLLLNGAGAAQQFTGVDGDISQIPFILAIGAIAFAIGVGMLAGLFPSLRAMKLSPLAAIRNE